MSGGRDGVIHAVGVINMVSGETGQRTGAIDVCRSDNGTVHVRVNRFGDEVVLVLPPPIVRRLIDILQEAVGP